MEQQGVKLSTTLDKRAHNKTLLNQQGVNVNPKDNEITESSGETLCMECIKRKVLHSYTSRNTLYFEESCSDQIHQGRNTYIYML